MNESQTQAKLVSLHLGLQMDVKKGCLAGIDAQGNCRLAKHVSR